MEGPGEQRPSSRQKGKVRGHRWARSPSEEEDPSDLDDLDAEDEEAEEELSGSLADADAVDTPQQVILWASCAGDASRACMEVLLSSGPAGQASAAHMCSCWHLKSESCCAGAVAGVWQPAQGLAGQEAEGHPTQQACLG